ncbi:MAG: antitoxin family protein [Roseiflexaceae bacterium]|nr:antitoxin family protein [Roseiflexaceae bacterium]
MDHTITAVYENGVLRPLQPLSLPEHTQVEIDVRQIVAPEIQAAHRLRVQQVLANAGILADAPDSTLPLPMLPAQRAQLAKSLAEAGVPPLSAAILDEREAR